MVKAIGFGEESKYGEDIDVTKWITPVVDNIRKEHKAIIGHAVTGAKKGELFEFALHSTPILTFPPTRWQRLKAWARSTFRRLVAWVRGPAPLPLTHDFAYGQTCHIAPKDGE